MKTVQTNAFLVEVNPTLLSEANLSESAIQHIVNSFEGRIQEEKRKRFFLQSRNLACGFFFEKEDEKKLRILDLVEGDLYYNTGMQTFHLQDYLKDNE